MGLIITFISILIGLIILSWIIAIPIWIFTGLHDLFDSWRNRGKESSPPEDWE